ncbi:MAG: T9SS C-terminal target domain-containing protein [Flavobacteriia bacterium]|jgi:flagellar hook assembly protein FlgD|nr:T9SS C-terminal target domain-containing protein [Flavobacteriia bacterium]
MKVAIYNAQGALMRDLTSQIVSGQHQLNWNGLGSDNNPCPPGLYYISVNRNGRFFSAKLVKQ